MRFIKKLIEEYKFNDFQFSLWDSYLTPLMRPESKVLLSILFMRFCYKIPLWRTRTWLSILFMRFLHFFKKKFWGYVRKPFNSLYEILQALARSSFGLCFQFSLWDSNLNKTGLQNLRFILSILFMRFVIHIIIMGKKLISFNSLYEIQPRHQLTKLLQYLTFNSLYEIHLKWLLEY